MIEAFFIYMTVFFVTILVAFAYQKLLVLDNRYLGKNASLYNGFSLLRYPFYIAILIPTVFLGSIREGMGKDYWSYLNYFHMVNSMDPWILLKEFPEPLYTLLNYIADALIPGKDWSIYFLSSLLTMLFILLTLDYYKKKLSIPMGLFIYFMLYYIESLNIIKQMLAVSIVLYSYRFILDRKFFRYIFFIIIATLFHQSAFICILFYFLNFKKNNRLKIKRGIFYIFIIISPILIAPVISLLKYIPFLDFYTSEFNFSFNGGGLGFLIDVLPVIVPVLLFRKRLVAENPNYELFINIALISLPFRIIGYYQYWASRMVYYSTAIQIIIIPIILWLIKDKQERSLAYYLIIVFYIIMFVYEYVIKNTGPAYPFTSIFQHITPF
ncbi:EpsG family protein [Priestia megaterium]